MPDTATCVLDVTTYDMKKAIIITVSILIILVAGFFVSRAMSAKNQVDVLTDLEVVTVERGTMPFTIGAKGRVYSNQSAVLSWKISGKVAQVAVSPGARVSAGDILAILDTDSLPPNVILAQSDLVVKQSALDDVYQSQMQQANAYKAVADARKALEDAQNPALSQAQAQVEVATSRAELEEAQRQYDILTALVPASAINQAYANLLLAQDKLAQTRETVQQIEQQILFGAAGLPEFVPDVFRTKVRTDIRKALRQALEGLQIQLTQDQLAYQNSLARYNNLLEPPDPIAVAVAEANLAAAKLQLEDAESRWDQLKDGPSDADIAVLEAVLADAQREWQRLKDGPDPNDILALEAQIAASQATLIQTRISAPFDGIITWVQTQPGDQVGPGVPALRVDDVSHLFVDLEISEIDINQIEVGQDVNLAFEAVLAKTYHGKVVEVAEVGTVMAGSVSFLVRVEILNADEDIRIGMTSDVDIVTRQKENVLAVPNRAIRALDGEPVVYLLGGAPAHVQDQDRLLEAGGLLAKFNARDPGLYPVQVSLGEASSRLTEVIAGDLEPGDQVVVDPPSELTQIPSSRSSTRIIFRHP
jgi:HlyD family secretion protein